MGAMSARADFAKPIISFFLQNTHRSGNLLSYAISDTLKRPTGNKLQFLKKKMNVDSGHLLLHLQKKQTQVHISAHTE